MIEQKQLIDEVVEDQYWIIITDGGRADFYEQIIRESEILSLDEYQRVYNSGVATTSKWFTEMFHEEYDATLFHGGRSIGEYKEQDHFEQVPNAHQYSWGCGIGDTSDPESVVELVLDSDADSGVIRFLQPHNPYAGLPIRTEREAERYADNKLAKHYDLTYTYIMPLLIRLIDQLEGTIIITSDHGQCLGDCGQYLHSSTHELHDHLTDVPWHVVN
jgi:hypothetical protein